MATVSTNEFKNGLKLMLDGEPSTILDNETVKPGKGQAFNRVKIRKLISGKVLEKTFKSGETVEVADVMECDLDYLYSDGEFWHFMNAETFEQIAADAKAIGDNEKWLVEQDSCVITLWNGSPIIVTHSLCDILRDLFKTILIRAVVLIGKVAPEAITTVYRTASAYHQ